MKFIKKWGIFLEPKMGFGKKFINSLYNFKAYNVFFSQSLGKGILYLFLLCLCLSTVNNIFLAFSLNSWVETAQDALDNNVPDFTFSKGQLNVQGEMPIIFEEENNTLIYIDTENEVDASVLDNYTSGIILTKDKMIQKENSMKVTTVNLKDMKDFSFDKSDVSPLLSTLKTVGTILMFIFFPIFSFVSRLLVGGFVIMGLGGLIISAILKKNFKYTECVKLGLYSLTVPFIIEIILSIFDFKFYGFSILYYGIAFLYLFLGVQAIDNTPDSDKPFEITN